MQWDVDFRRKLDRALRRLRLGPLSFCDERCFPDDYRARMSPRYVMRDVLRLESVARSGEEAFDLRPAVGAPADAPRRILVYSARPHTLDEILPLLRHLRLRVLDQIQFVVSLEGRQFFIRDFSVSPVDSPCQSLAHYKTRLVDALGALLAGRIESDALNGLILSNGFNWKKVELFRAYCNYYAQIAKRFERPRVHRALLANSEPAALLFKYFEARFLPDARLGDAERREAEALPQLRMELITALEKVHDVGDDRILRDLFNLIDATLRTNFFQRCDKPEFFISVKIASLGVINMPSPRPLVEIYVHSRLMEGVHLRGAEIARGGVRWSDRPDDFRNEILDLMQTQMIKNALIVPQGAKGGFVLKADAAEAKERQRLGREAYATLIRGLLDLTDNVMGSEVQSPLQLVCYDDADPYLVVAADKGTAGLSDLANEIASEYGYWFGDGFATGGSKGYHHKRLGVTARGAWVCMKRHFYELGRDIDQQTFTVVGVGGMEGDVFGNGMLQSSNICLLGAFTAEHIFIDPNPDRFLSFGERKRLFETPGSSWRDYNAALISSGGGVYSRSAKDIPLSAPAREWLGARSGSIDGGELIRLLLKAPVDVLWMGGVGSYVRASTETDETVGDRANDGARIEATAIRAKVVTEGANLALTQRARVEYALGGGRINTDAIDNSAGVDLSDHEVNLKILLSSSSDAGASKIAREERDRLLLQLTDEVLGAVLLNNHRQSLCLSLERERCVENVGPFMDAADQLVNAGFLDREVESFPTRKDVLSRGAVLTRPELAVLMAYAKLALKRALLGAPELLDKEWTRAFLADYFPAPLRGRYSKRLEEHLLRREIAATVICNRVIDQAGATFLVWSEEADPVRLAEHVSLYLAFDQILQGDRWRDAVRALDGKMAAARQYELLLQLENALASLCRWGWEHGRRLTPNSEAIDKWRAELGQYLEYLGESAEFAVLASAAPEASRLLFLTRLRDFPVLVDLASQSRENLGVVAKALDALVKLLGLRQIATLVAEMRARDPWEARLQACLDDRLRSAAARFVRLELQSGHHDPTGFFHQYALDSRVAKFQRLRREIIATPPLTLTPFAVLAGELESLIDACGAASEMTE
jgi:glutamate dehydrogenase